MAVGDVVSDLQSIAAVSYLDIQPAGTEEWIIHNIYHEFDVQLEWYDGVNSIVFHSSVGPGILARFTFHINNARWIRVYNPDPGVAKLIGYDGVVSRM
jgi:hypothetical protein